MRKFVLMTGVLAVALLAGCQEDPMSSGNMLADSEASLKTQAVTTTEPQTDQAVLAAMIEYLTPAASKNGAQQGGMIWADGSLFGTIGTPTSFNPEHGPFDILFQGAFRDGIGAISESKPGDQDYNGGRWDVYVLKEGVMTDYSDVDSADDLNWDDFEPAHVYLECPLLPRK